MREGRAEMLGFGAVALGIAAVPVAFFLFTERSVETSPPNIQGTVAQAFLAVEVEGDGAQPVPAIDRLFPLGTPQVAALPDLAANGFACTAEGRETLCRRSIQHASLRENWTVSLRFDEGGKLAARSGEIQVARR